ncbi:CinA family protein [Polymorphospora lycopeni]|uniref:CinA family protein n=1 Tax=Polymorphospora lycopeni TaxID=3140240 RepID=A0ABV5CTQ9_9ACTN
MTAGRPAGVDPAGLTGLVDRLKARGSTLATAESLTGGLLAATLVEVPGVSAVFRGGLVVYATELKGSLAGVPAGLLAERGPVDPDVAVALADGARAACGADWGLATTGVAGPEPQDGKPVGLVYVAVAGPSGPAVRRLTLDGDRTAVRAGTVVAALRLLAEQIDAATGVGGTAAATGVGGTAAATGVAKAAPATSAGRGDEPPESG